MKVSFYTLGCKVNQAETEEMMKLLENAGADVVPFGEKEDVCVVNSCTVTSRGDADTRQAVRKAVRNNPSCRVVVTGCYSLLHPEETGGIPGVSAVCGNSGKRDIVEYVQKALSGKSGLGPFSFREDSDLFMPASSFKNSNRTRAFLKVQDGCDSFCSYCIVPYVRGANRSASAADVADRFRELLDDGFKEIVLTGIHLGNFGKERNDNSSLEELLAFLVSLDGNFRIRLSSVEPREITGRLLDIMMSSDKICRHLHIPLQSGDDRMLKRMKRDYASRFFYELVEMIYMRMDDINIGCDIIAGFPGEEDEHFKNTARLIEKLPLGYLHVFSYSDRDGTEAASYHDKVSSSVIKERADELRVLGRAKKIEFRKRFIGEKARVLVEGDAKKYSGKLKGFSDNYIPVVFNRDNTASGEFVTLRLSGFDGDRAVYGEAE